MLRAFVAGVVVLVIPSCIAADKPTVVLAARTVTALDGGPSIRDGGRLCLDRRAEGLTVRGCWDVQRNTSEADPEHDYLIWVFRGSVTPDGSRHVRRVRALITMDGAEVSWWNPSRDLKIDEARTVDASYRRPDGQVLNEYEGLPGRIHPYIEENLFSVEWTPSAASISQPAEVGAVVEWAVPEGGTGVKVTTSLEAVLQAR